MLKVFSYSLNIITVFLLGAVTGITVGEMARTRLDETEKIEEPETLDKTWESINDFLKATKKD